LLAFLIAAGGCAANPTVQQHPAMIPADARIVAQGKPTISFLITHPGILYIYDDTTHSLINSMDLTNIPHASPTMLVIDKAKAAVLGGEPANNGPSTVLMSPIDTSHDYTIWFQSPGATCGGDADHCALPTTAPAKPQH
jgi:hypothetical protein